MTDPSVTELAAQILNYVAREARTPHTRRLQTYAERLALDRKREALAAMFGGDLPPGVRPVRGGFLCRSAELPGLMMLPQIRK